MVLGAVASIGEQQRHPGHFAFFTDRAGQDIDATDPEQLFLPGLRFDVFFGYGITTSEHLTA